MKVLTLTIGDSEAASTRYRIVQYERFLKENDIEIQYIHKDEIDTATVDLVKSVDVVLNQKCLFKTSTAKKILAKSKRTVFDFDDAIWTRPGKPHSFLTRRRVCKRFHLWLKNADIVTTPNRYLAEYAEKYSSKVKTIPMSLDLQKWHPGEKVNDGLVRIGWAGSPGNLSYIKALEPVLKELASRYDNLKIMIYCGEKPNLECPFVYTPYKTGTEADFIRQLDIGLLPLENDEFERGKSPIKAIQYLSCGVTVVGNIHGATSEILQPTNRRTKISKAGVAFVRKYHDIHSVEQQFVEALRGPFA
ncbi:MAG: hypothetical protein JRF37_11365 [Deltaproteobacteria bacterium]|nr:hypothetical protein [Deltaproteobacteria bacterium]